MIRESACSPHTALPVYTLDVTLTQRRISLQCSATAIFLIDHCLCWLLVTSVQKNRDRCQQHHEGPTLSYWLHEPSTEKSVSDLFRNLLLCCFFGEKSEVMKRFCFEAGSVLPGKDTDALLVVVI